MSALNGMTGFARASGEADWGAWAWEAKSVNGRGLDVRVNAPPGFDALERAVKAGAAKRFKRGSLQVSLRIELEAGAGEISVNEAALGALLKAFEAAAGARPGAAALATLMTAKGVVETGGTSLRDLAGDDAVLNALTRGADETLDKLGEARADEGESLSATLSGLLNEMRAAAEHANSAAAQQPALVKARMEKQLSELGAQGAVDAERLAAEIALQAAKADVREELDRLAAHFETGRALLDAGSPAGRKLDFLAQELNREANTLCSKSASLELTNAGLALKALIDQFKEQAANAE